MSGGRRIATPVTGCCLTLRQLQRSLAFGTASKLTFLRLFFPNCFQSLVLYTVYSSGLAVLYLVTLNNSNVNTQKYLMF